MVGTRRAIGSAAPAVSPLGSRPVTPMQAASSRYEPGGADRLRPPSGAWRAADGTGHGSVLPQRLISDALPPAAAVLMLMLRSASSMSGG
jgi:hypothetical protein